MCGKPGKGRHGYLTGWNRVNIWKTHLNHDILKSIDFLNSDEIVSDGNFLKL
jgi:hypothetical protein